MRFGPSLMIGSVVMFVLGGISVGAQPGATNGEWRSFAADTFGSKYSPLEEITADSEIIQRNLEVVTFNPGEEPVAAAVAEAGAESGHKRLLIGLVVFNLLAFGLLGYLRYRNRAVAS